MTCNKCGTKLKNKEKICENCRDNPIDGKALLAYEALKAKQLSYDNLMWQTPVLGITAQSFLYTIAFDSSKSIEAQFITAFLGIILGFASFQLMIKHRYHERITTDRLEIIENKNNLIFVHDKPKKAKKGVQFYWLVNLSSYSIWRNALILTSIGGLYALINSINLFFR